MTDFTFAELFAGGGGLSRGLELAGWQCRWHCENEEQAASVLKIRWPNVPIVGDVRNVDGREMVRLYGRILLLSGGSPCQGLSSAGLRKGLIDIRSVLFYEQMRLWDETGADLCLWENVDNARHSNDGEDFGEVLRAFVGAPVHVPSSGWRSAGVAAGPSGVAAWRVLDAQFFGVPQRRSRLFVVGTRTGIVDPAEVLSLTEGLRRHSSPSRRAGKRIAHAPSSSARSSSGSGDELGGFGLLDRTGGVADPITASEGDTYTHEGENNFRLHNVTLENADAIAFNTKQDGHDASADVAPTLLAMPHDESHANGGGQLGVVSLEPVPLDMRQLRRGEKQTKSGRGGDNPNSGTPGTGIGKSGDPSPTLGAGGGPPAVVAFDLAQITHPENRSTVRPGDPAPTLNRSGAVHVVSLDAEGNSSEKVSGTLVTHHSPHNRGAVVEVFNEVGHEKWQEEQIAGTVSAHEAKECHTIISERVGDVASPITPRSGPAPDRGDGLDNIVVGKEPEQTDAFAFTKSHYTRGRPGGPSPIVPTLAADTGQGDNEPLVLDVAGTLNARHAGGFQSAQSAAAGHLVVDSPEVVGTLSATDGKSQLWSTQSVISGHVLPTMGIPRRLMPLECERLMGWDDGWTDVPDPKKKNRSNLKDSARYRICGNGVTRVQAQWLGERLILELVRA